MFLYPLVTIHDIELVSPEELSPCSLYRDADGLVPGTEVRLLLTCTVVSRREDRASVATRTETMFIVVDGNEYCPVVKVASNSRWWPIKPPDNMGDIATKLSGEIQRFLGV